MFVNTSPNVHPISLILVTKKNKAKTTFLCVRLSGFVELRVLQLSRRLIDENPAHDSLSTLRSHLNNIYSFLQAVFLQATATFYWSMQTTSLQKNQKADIL